MKVMSLCIKVMSLCITVVVMAMTASPASAILKIQTFETQPAFEEPEARIDPLPVGTWGIQQDSLGNVDELAEPPVLLTPFWNNVPGGGGGGSDGWLTGVGTETPLNNRGAIGAVNYAGIPITAILTNQFPGLLVYDNGSWGDVSAATFVTLDVKGSFAGSGGISLYVHGEGSTLWSWTAAVSNEAVGANPGDVTEWTTILIPINKPTIQMDFNVFPSANGTEGHIDGALEDGGNWGANQDFASDAEMIASFNLTLSTVNRIDVRGITPDTQIDNLGFVIPDVDPTGDFDLDGDVDGSDFLAWQRGESPSPLSASDLAVWQGDYGTPAAVASIAAVPEPSTIVMTLLAVCGLLGVCRKK